MVIEPIGLGYVAKRKMGPWDLIMEISPQYMY